MNTINKWLVDKPLIVLFSFWILTQSILFFIVGVEFGFEGDKYIEDAYLFINHNAINTDRLFYSVYSLLIAISIKIGIGLWAVIVFQLFLNAFATFVFFKLTKLLFQNSITPIITSLLFVLIVQIQQWNFFLFTESVFISITVLLYYVVAKFDKDKSLDYIKFSSILLLLAFIRPSGLFYTVPAIVFFIGSGFSKHLSTKILIPVFAISLIIVANLIYNQGNFAFHYGLADAKRWIIGGYDMPSTHSESAGDIIILYFMRIVYYFSNWRPFFSLSHNLFILFSLLPIYVLAIIAMLNFYGSKHRIKTFALITIAVFTAFAMLTFVNWHGRFLAVILPAIIILAGYGVDAIVARRNKETMP